MQIPFPASGSAIVVPQLSKNFSELNIIRFVDEPEDKIVSVDTLELGRIYVYTGSAYDSNTNWTKNQVTASLLTRFSLE